MTPPRLTNSVRRFEKTGDFGGARDALESSLKVMPGQLPARILLGSVYINLKDAKAAQDQFEAALLVDRTVSMRKSVLAEHSWQREIVRKPCAS